MEFMNKENLNKPGVRYPLGFTFSFPCKQEGLASARLSTWTKGFTCSGVVNEDVVKMLQTAIDEKVRDIIANLLCLMKFSQFRISMYSVSHLSMIQLAH